MASRAKTIGDLIAADASVAIPGDGVVLASDLADDSVTRAKIADTVPLGTKNLIINGDMRIDQRNAGASVTPSASAYTLDRWYAQVGAASKYSVQQNAGSVTPPVGFSNYLGITSTSAYSVGSAELFDIRQSIEGYNVADLAWGTANAKTITISFWVRSSLTGTFGGFVANSAYNRAYVFNYTISSANTWEQKTVTIAGDTSGTWLTTNGAGLILSLTIASGAAYQGAAGSWVAGSYFSTSGQTSVVGTNGATLYITGVQLEVGDAATPFEHRPYDMELQRCRRYYQQLGGNSTFENFGQGCSFSATNTYIQIQFVTQMRANPSLEYSNLSHFRLHYPGVVGITPLTSMALVTDDLSPTMAVMNVATASDGNAGGGKCFQLTAENSTSARIKLSAEL